MALPCPSVGLRDGHRPPGRRTGAARRQPMPEPLPVVLHPRLTLRKRLPIHAGGSLLRLHLLRRFPALLLGNTARLCLPHRLLPLLGGSVHAAPPHHPCAPSR